MFLLLDALIAGATTASTAALTATSAAAASATVAAQDYLHAPSPLADQIGAAAISSYIIQQMKKSNLPAFAWLNDHNTLVTRAVSVVFAILSTSGIHALWHGNGASVLQGGTFVVNLADGWLHELQQSVWKTTQSFIMQQMVYQGLLKHEAGQTAVDKVADVVEGHKADIAEVVEKQEAAHDPNSLLRLKDNPAIKQKIAEKQVVAQQNDTARPLEWDWNKKEYKQ